MFNSLLAGWLACLFAYLCQNDDLRNYQKKNGKNTQAQAHEYTHTDTDTLTDKQQPECRVKIKHTNGLNTHTPCN